MKDDYAIVLTDTDFDKGSLNQQSNIIPNRLFTADKNIISKNLGTIKPDIFEQVVDKLFEIIKN